MGDDYVDDGRNRSDVDGDSSTSTRIYAGLRAVGRRRVTTALARSERGSAVPEFVLVLLLFIPLVAGIAQLGLTLHVRNTLTAAASDGARAGASLGATSADAEARSRQLIADTLSDSFVSTISATEVDHAGIRVMRVQAGANVPVLGLVGSGVEVKSQAHAVIQEPW